MPKLYFFQLSKIGHKLFCAGFVKGNLQKSIVAHRLNRQNYACTKGLMAYSITNGISHAKLLSKRNFRVVILGGQLKSTTEAVIGLAAANNLQNYNFTKAFLGTNGITETQGFSTPDSEEAFVKAAAIDRSFVSYVLADSSKFGKVSSVSFATVDRACIITDKKPDGNFEKLTVIKVIEKA